MAYQFDEREDVRDNQLGEEEYEFDMFAPDDDFDDDDCDDDDFDDFNDYEGFDDKDDRYYDSRYDE